MRKQNVEFVETVKTFIEDYNGFDWEHGTIVLVVNHTPYILSGQWRVVLEKHLDKKLLHWTHDENVMVLTV